MAKIFNKFNDTNLILSPREAVYRRFNFGQWTELRVGMLFNVTNDTNDSGSANDEEVYRLSDLDRIYFGIKSYGNEIPGEAGTDFIGVTSLTSSYVYIRNGAAGSYYNSGGSLYYRVALGAASASLPLNTKEILTTSTTNGLVYPSVPGSPCGFYGLKYVLQNSGSANQCVILNYKSTSTAGSSSADLNTLLTNNTSWNSMYSSDASYSTASWAAGISLPDTFYTYIPSYRNRLRITAIQLMKIS
jgi:hypothetical protein